MAVPLTVTTRRSVSDPPDDPFDDQTQIDLSELDEFRGPYGLAGGQRLAINPIATNDLRKAIIESAGFLPTADEVDRLTRLLRAWDLGREIDLDDLLCWSECFNRKSASVDPDPTDSWNHTGRYSASATGLFLGDTARITELELPEAVIEYLGMSEHIFDALFIWTNGTTREGMLFGYLKTHELSSFSSNESRHSALDHFVDLMKWHPEGATPTTIEVARKARADRKAREAEANEQSRIRTEEAAERARQSKRNRQRRQLRKAALLTPVLALCFLLTYVQYSGGGLWLPGVVTAGMFLRVAYVALYDDYGYSDWTLTLVDLMFVACGVWVVTAVIAFIGTHGGFDWLVEYFENDQY